MESDRSPSLTPIALSIVYVMYMYQGWLRTLAKGSAYGGGGAKSCPPPSPPLFLAIFML